MNRRDALAMLGGTLLLRGTLVAKAQTAKSIRRIGVLSLGAPLSAAQTQAAWAAAREYGWIEGQNVIVERRYVGNKAELLQANAAELVRLDVEIILTFGTAATIAAKNATTRIPIVMISAGDPVRAGLVASLAKPGGNVTGFSNIAPDLDDKRLALLHELLPSAKRIGVIVNTTDPYFEIARDKRERAYRTIGVQPIIIEIAGAGDLEKAVAELARRRAEALIVGNDNLLYSNRDLLMRAALRHALPTIVGDKELIEAGGLLSLAIDDTEQYRSFAYFLDKILRGAKPADLPVQQPTKFVLSINLKTAKALNLTIPQALLQQADEVIQ